MFVVGQCWEKLNKHLKKNLSLFPMDCSALLIPTVLRKQGLTRQETLDPNCIFEGWHQHSPRGISISDPGRQGPKSPSVQRGFRCSLTHTQSLFEAHRGQSAHWNILSLNATMLKQSAGLAQQVKVEEVGAQSS